VKLEYLLKDWEAPPNDERRLVSEKALRAWIQENVNLKLKGVPWDLTDAKLVPEAGACSTCLKRSVSNPGLFAELVIKDEDTCFDGTCYKRKREAFVQLQLKQSKENTGAVGFPGENFDKDKDRDEEKPLLQLSEQSAFRAASESTAVFRAGQWLPAKKGSCDAVAEGIIVRGENAGKKHHVCIDPKCKVHKHTLSKSPARDSTGQKDDYAAEQLNRHRGNIRAQKRAVARRVLVREMLDKVGPKLPPVLLRAIIADYVNTGWSHGAQQMLDLMGVKPDKGENAVAKLNRMIERGSEAVLNKVLVAERLAVTYHNSDDKKERAELVAIAKAIGVKNPHGVLSREDDRVNKLRQCRECGCTEETACQFYDHKKGKDVACSWTNEGSGEPLVCSNELCQSRAAKKQTPAKARK
jgi:hypothetical protein